MPGMDALVSEVLSQARHIAEDVVKRTGVRLRTATVTSTSPVRIRYDGEDAASVVTPRTLAAVNTDDRVVVAKTRGQATILGRLGVAEWQTLTTSGSWVYAGHGAPFEILREGDHRWIRGRLKLRNDAPIPRGEVTVASIPSDDRPVHTSDGSLQVAGFKNPGYGRMELTTGGDLKIGLSKESGWVGFDSIHWTTS